MLTLDNHLAGVTADRPHPESYRPDFPLRSELAGDPERMEELDEAREEGRDLGYNEGTEDAEEAAQKTLAAERRKHEQEVATLRQQLEAKRA